MPTRSTHSLREVSRPLAAGAARGLALGGFTAIVLLAPMTLSCGAPPAEGADAPSWPGWRGPERSARSPDGELLQEWPEGGPPLVWQASGLGTGFSSVAVADGRIYTLGDDLPEPEPAPESGETEGEAGADAADAASPAGVEEEVEALEYVIALDAENGAELWRTAIGKAWNEADLYPGSRSTPSVAGDAVVALGSDGTVARLDAGTGEVLWTRHLERDFGGAISATDSGYTWTYSESPLIDGDRVIVTPGRLDAALVALRLDDGEEIWRAQVPEFGESGLDGAGYSSVVIGEGGGVRQYVQLLGRGLVGVRASDGGFLWSYGRVANDVASIPTPLVHGDHVFASSGYGTGAALLELAADGEGGVSAREVYFLEGETFQNHHGGMVLVDGTVYAGTGHNRGFPIAVDLLTGEILWGPERNEGRGSAAVAYADDRLYFRYQSGLMLLVEASREAYREHGSFEIPDVRDPSWSHPVIVGGRLYLREQDRIYVYDVSAPSEQEGST